MSTCSLFNENEMHLLSCTDSAPPPEYTPSATESEQTLAQSGLVDPNCNLSTGTITRTSGNITVVLDEQDSDAETPSYGRQGVISGILNLDHVENISKVTLQIKGKLKLSITGNNAVSKTVRTVDQRYELWSSRSTAVPDSSHEAQCPQYIPFSSILPSTFKDGDREVALPPSYEVTFLGLPSLFARCTYTLKVTVHTHRTLFERSKTLRIPLNYRPRKRPPQPILPDPRVLSTVKTSPEEWYELPAELKARSSSTIKSLQALLFVPAVRTFAITDNIPFHIQFSGPISSLREFYSHVRLIEGSDDLSSSSSSSSSSSQSYAQSTPPPPFSSQTYYSHDPNIYTPQSPPQPQCSACSSSSSPSSTSSRTTPRSDPHKNNLLLTLSLTLERQVLVGIKGQVVWKSATIGSGTLRALPPSVWSETQHQHQHRDHGMNADSEASIDWEGQVRCRSDVKVGHFDAGKIAVKDYLVLTVSTRPNQSAFFPLKMVVPIALVTDTWTER